MIQFMTPVLATNGRNITPVSWLALLWRRRHPYDFDVTLPSRKILDVVDRVRGAEATLARLKAEAQCEQH